MFRLPVSFAVCDSVRQQHWFFTPGITLHWEKRFIKAVSLAFLCSFAENGDSSVGESGKRDLPVFFFSFSFWPRCEACGILVPQPGIEPAPSAVKVPSPNHWTARELPVMFIS